MKISTVAIKALTLLSILSNSSSLEQQTEGSLRGSGINNPEEKDYVTDALVEDLASDTDFSVAYPEEGDEELVSSIIYLFLSLPCFLSS